MNGYVLAWMAVSSGPAMAVGILIGRKIEFNNAFQAGKESAEVINQYDRTYGQFTATEKLEAMRRAEAKTLGPHGHLGPCSHEQGCW